MCYVYKFLDNNNQLLYIGKTMSEIKYRMSQQFNNGNLKKEIYSQVNTVEYCKCLNKDDMSIKAMYLINTLHPLYNIDFNNNYSFNFVIDDFDWKIFNLKELKELRNKVKPKNNRGVINTKDVEIENYIDTYGYTNIKHNGCTPRYYSCEVISKVYPYDDKVYYYIVDGCIYIPLRTFRFSGTETEYRNKLIKHYGGNKTDFITLKDKTSSTSSEYRKILINCSKSFKLVGEEVKSYKKRFIMSDYNKKKLEILKDFQGYLEIQNISTIEGE